MKESVCRVVLCSFDEGKLLSEVNEMVVTLGSKVPCLKSLRQLRPISFCNFLIKIISRFLDLSLL